MSFLIQPDVAAPYPGLRPFLRDESVIFFGRDEQIDDVLGRLKTHGFLGIVGTSGCGKSSLIRAGVLPALESGLMGELGSTWFVADMKPGDAPLTNLAKALITCGVFAERWSDTPEGVALLAAALRRSDVSLVNLVLQADLPPYTNLLVLADQFEEIFRFQQQDPNEALAFVNLLLAASRQRSVRLYVVLTMRSDYLGTCSLFPGLPEALNDAQYLCPRLTRDQLAQAIERPAEVFGGRVEQSLVKRIVNDARDNSDQLPLVQHVLARMWNERLSQEQSLLPEASEKVLRGADYERVGGLIGLPPLPSTDASQPIVERDVRRGQNALSQHADEAYFELADQRPESHADGPAHKPSRRQRIAQMLFRCLAERGASGQYVRRPMKVQAVAAIADCSPQEVIDVVEVFRRQDRSFLVPAVDKLLTAESVLDISHEALIRQWQRFGGGSEAAGEHESAQSWLEVEEQFRRRYRRLAEAAENEPVAGLLMNPELGFLNQWWEDFRPTRAWADALVKDSFDQTDSLRKRSLNQAIADEQAKEAEQRQRVEFAEAQARRALARERTRTQFLIFIAIVALVAMGLTYHAWRSQARAERAEQMVRDQELKAIDAAEVAETQAKRARMGGYNQSISAAEGMWRTYPDDAINRLASAAYYLPENRDFAWHYLKRRADRASISLPPLPLPESPDLLTIAPGPEPRVAWWQRESPGSSSFELFMWNLAVDETAQKLTVIGIEPVFLTYTNDSKYLLWVDQNGRLQNLPLAPDSHSLIFPVETGATIWASSPSQPELYWMVNRELHGFNYLDGAPLTDGPIANIIHSVAKLKVSRDGKTIVAASDTECTVLRMADDGAAIPEPSELIKEGRFLAVSPNGSHIAMSDANGSATLMSIQPRRGIIGVFNHDDLISLGNSADFSPDGEVLAIGLPRFDLPGAINVIDVSNAKTLAFLHGGLVTGGTGKFHYVNFIGDGTGLFTWTTGDNPGGREDGSPTVFDPTTDSSVLREEQASEVKTWGRFVRSTVNSDIVDGFPDSSIISIVENEIRLRESEETESVATAISPPVKTRILAAAVSADFQFVACIATPESASKAKSVFLRHIASKADWSQHRNLHNPTSLAFSPDGEWLAIGGAAEPETENGEPLGVIEIWSVANATPAVRPLRIDAERGTVNWVAFSPDGKSLATASNGLGFGMVDWRRGVIRVWDPITGQLRLTLRGHSSDALALVFSPDSKQLVSWSRVETLLWDGRPWSLSRQ